MGRAYNKKEFRINDESVSPAGTSPIADDYDFLD